MMNALILRLDISGVPTRWIPWQDAVALHVRDMIGWVAGDSVFTFRGGTRRYTGERSQVDVNSIIAVRRGTAHYPSERVVPPLTNRELFLRDANLCLYCGNEYPDATLTRDHIVPISRGGKDCWANVVAACKRCNTHKGNRTPEDARMPLLAIPYMPNWAEYLALSNRRILADQMEFLKPRFAATRQARLR